MSQVTETYNIPAHNMAVQVKLPVDQGVNIDIKVVEVQKCDPTEESIDSSGPALYLEPAKPNEL